MRKTAHEEEVEEKEENTISQLPDAILLHILSLMPLESVMRTSILSRRWKVLCRCHWAYATTLDFAQESFRRIQTPPQFVGIIDRYLQFHSGIDIDIFRLSFCTDIGYQSYIEKWIEFAVERRVKELDIDLRHMNWCFLTSPGSAALRCNCSGSFELPPCLFKCPSLLILKLTCCSFKPRSNFNGFSSLKTLYFKNVEITDGLLQRVLLNCRVLEELTLWNCYPLESVHISSSHELKLKRLTVSDCFGDSMEISAPHLLSFHVNDVLFNEYSFKNISKTKDAIMNETYSDLIHCNGTMILSQLAHVQILTLGDIVLGHTDLDVYGGAPIELPISFPNLIELQLLIIWDEDGFVDFYNLFRCCSFPYLEKLFIEIQRIDVDSLEDGEPPEYVFNNLKIIKMSNFHGDEIDMKLVKFLLNKAVVLESLFLIIPMRGLVNKNSICEAESCEAPLRLFQDQLLLLPRASSAAQIILCEYSNDDNTSHPTHMEVYDWRGFL